MSKNVNKVMEVILTRRGKRRIEKAVFIAVILDIALRTRDLLNE